MRQTGSTRLDISHQIWRDNHYNLQRHKYWVQHRRNPCCHRFLEVQTERLPGDWLLDSLKEASGLGSILVCACLVREPHCLCLDSHLLQPPHLCKEKKETRWNFDCAKRCLRHRAILQTKQKKFFKFKFNCNPLTGSQNIVITSSFLYTYMTLWSLTSWP